MSQYADEPCDVYDERYTKARKEHQCDACRESIAQGERYTSVRIIYDGTAQTIKRCARCQALHLHLRTLDTSGEMWPDERLDCGIEYTEHWNTSPPEPIAALAFVTSSEAQQALDLALEEGRRRKEEWQRQFRERNGG